MTIIEKQTAEDLGLCYGASAPREALGAGGSLTSSILNVDSIKVDNIEARDIQVGVMDLSNLAKGGCLGELGGIMGYNFVKNHKVTIDYPKQEISFEKA